MTVARTDRPAGSPLLEVSDLTVTHRVGGRDAVVHAVSGISFTVMPGETLGLVGESGCGKSSAARAILQLPRPTSGSVKFDGVELTALDAERTRRMRTDMQTIFQDPISSLNPRRQIGDVVAEPLRVWGPKDKAQQRRLVDEMLVAVGLDPESARHRRAGEFSGGQCQRISIARALVTRPRLVVCDEPVSALDVSVQAQILNLLTDLKERYDLTLIFIAHDLAVVKNISDRVAVMYLGQLCEIGAVSEIFERPAHHYTRLLLASGDHRRGDDDAVNDSEMPSPMAPPSGCRFRTRCPAAQDICAAEAPPMTTIGTDHAVACHFPVLRPAGPSTGGGEPTATSPEAPE